MQILGAAMIILLLIGVFGIVIHDCGIKQGSIMIFQAVCGTFLVWVAAKLLSGEIA